MRYFKLFKTIITNNHLTLYFSGFIEFQSVEMEVKNGFGCKNKLLCLKDLFHLTLMKRFQRAEWNIAKCFCPYTTSRILSLTILQLAIRNIFKANIHT